MRVETTCLFGAYYAESRFDQNWKAMLMRELNIWICYKIDYVAHPLEHKAMEPQPLRVDGSTCIWRLNQRGLHPEHECDFK